MIRGIETVSFQTCLARAGSHRFFSQAVWEIDHLWKLLAQLIVKTLAGAEGDIVLAGDDTLCRKRGLGIFGTGRHHDRLLRFVLSRDKVGGRPTRIFYSTNVKLNPKKILSLFSRRWSIEVTHFDCKQHLG